MKIRVAGIQIGATESKKSNIDKLKKFLDDPSLKQFKPHFICLPEMFSYLPLPDDTMDTIEAVSETIGGTTAKMLAQTAEKLKAYMVSGSYILREGGRYFNSSLLFDPNGNLIAHYNKIHLFDTPDFKESWFVAPGDRLVVADTEYCRIGLIICYDIRFPELLRSLVLKGADLIFCPAAFPVAGASPGEDHWQILTRAAALHNMVYVVAVNQIGIRKPFIYFGRSVVVDPWGVEIARAPNQECIIKAELDLDYLREMRKERSVLEHRRPDLYEL
jgi:predicted amidohydrolase